MKSRFIASADPERLETWVRYSTGLCRDCPARIDPRLKARCRACQDIVNTKERERWRARMAELRAR